jgi:Ni/Co efflux regulator RcnB
MIDRRGNPTGDLLIALNEETTMLKTISAALLAVSVLAAPALAAGQGNVAQAPVTAKSNSLDANARMSHRHVRHHRHHRHHKHMGALKKHYISKITIKHGDRIVKRG